MSDIAEYLVSLKYAKACDHREEVEDFKEVLDKCSEEVFNLLHERHAAAPRDTASALAAPRRSSFFKTFVFRAEIGKAHPRCIYFHLQDLEKAVPGLL